MRAVAIIPARGGSKGIVRKNIRDVGGKPLIYYQLKNALDSKLIAQVVLATDDIEIAQVGKTLFGNAITILIRPPEISTDTSKTEETLLWVVKQIQADIVVTLEPTNPLNKSEYIDSCIRLLVESNFDSVCCAVKNYNFFLDTSQELARVMKRPMKQDLKPRYHEVGNCWVTKTSTLQLTQNRLGGKMGVVVIPVEDSYHLDTISDWKIIDALIRSRTYYSERSGVVDYEESYWKATDPDGVTRDKLAEHQKSLNNIKEELAYLNMFSGKILDVGCGLGVLLSGLNNGWEKFGVEPSKFACEHARQYGNVFNGKLEDANYQSNFFDAVVLYHVIEHLSNPLEVVKEVNRVLKPGGKLVVGTPDFDSAVSQQFKDKFRMLHDPGHVSLFSLLGLHRLLIDCGFEVVQVRYPFFNTEYFTEQNLMRLFRTDEISPPAIGNIITMYAYKK